MSIIIYHNPNCSKSKETLSLLQETGHQLDIRLYLQHQFTLAELQSIVQKLGLSSVADMMRKNDDLYRTLGLEQASDEQRLQALIEHSSLLERPIVVNGEKAKIGRPPESVLEIL